DEPGKSIEAEISGGRIHSYKITMSAGQFAGLEIQQRGIDVAERLFASDGKLVAEFDDELRPQEQEEAEFVAEPGGTYRLDITAKFKGASGRYEIRLVEVRGASERDRL